MSKRFEIIDVKIGVVQLIGCFIQGIKELTGCQHTEEPGMTIATRFLQEFLNGNALKERGVMTRKSGGFDVPLGKNVKVILIHVQEGVLYFGVMENDVAVFSDIKGAVSYTHLTLPTICSV